MWLHLLLFLATVVVFFKTKAVFSILSAQADQFISLQISLTRLGKLNQSFPKPIVTQLRFLQLSHGSPSLADTRDVQTVTLLSAPKLEISSCMGRCRPPLGCSGWATTFHNFLSRNESHPKQTHPGTAAVITSLELTAWLVSVGNH